MDVTRKRPNPPLSLAGQDDLHILSAAIKRLAGFSRPLADTDLARPETRLHYHLLRARAITLEAIKRVGE
jgi:hypothetical protein